MATQPVGQEERLGGGRYFANAKQRKSSPRSFTTGPGDDPPDSSGYFTVFLNFHHSLVLDAPATGLASPILIRKRTRPITG